MLRIAHRQTATVEQTGPVRLFVDGDVALLAVCGRDHHQAISQQGFAASRINRFFLHRVVHPFLIGRDEQISRSPRFDLAGQRGRGGKRRNDLDVFLFFVYRSNILHRVSQRRRRKDRDFSFIRQRVAGE